MQLSSWTCLDQH
uniref:Uncharacterized protein n=1 Tax=Lepeophtheirus salmonis TaxID=72036 RepID=A0A0K2UJ63_LEPSM